MKRHNKKARLLLTLIVVTTMILAAVPTFGTITEEQPNIEKELQQEPQQEEVERCCPPWFGSLVIKKVCSDDGPVKGIGFTLEGKNGRTKTGETDRWGIVSFAMLPAGEYNLTEETPEGYTNDIDNPILLNSDTASRLRILEVTVTNTKDPEPEIFTIKVKKVFRGPGKYDSEGIEFILSNGDDFEETKSINSDGFLVFENVPKGEYLLTEDTPDGFTSSIEGGKEISLPKDADNQNYMEIRVINTKIPEPDRCKVIIQKQIRGDYSLEGFEFELWLDGKKAYGPETTNSEGQAIFNNVEEGTYDVVENLTPQQAEKFEPEEGVVVTCTCEGEVRDLEIEPNCYPCPQPCEVTKVFNNYIKEGWLKVVKKVYDADGNRLKVESWEDEFHFKLRKSTGEEEAFTLGGENLDYKEFTLPFGTHNVEEISIPEGYTVNNSYQNITISLDSPSGQLIFINTMESEEPPVNNGKIKVEKRVRKDGELVDPEDWEDDFYFTMTGPNGFRKEFRFRSDFTMRTFPKLEYGTYTVTETTVDGYVVDGNPKKATVDSDNKYKQIIFRNTIMTEEEKYEDVIVQKIVLDKDGRELEYNEDKMPEGEKKFNFMLINEGQEYGPVSTDEYGEAYFEDVMLGEYEVVEVLSTQQAIMFEPQEDVFITVVECDMIPYSIETRIQEIPYPQIICNRVTFTNKLRDDERGTLRIIKKVNDRRNSSPDLSGFEFKLYRMLEGEEAEEMIKTTPSSGIVEFTNLVEGKYKLYETNRSNYIEGIGREGKELILNEETAPNHLYELVVTNIRDYPRDDDDDDDDDDDNDDDDKDKDEPEEEEEEPQDRPVVIIVPEPIAEVAPVVESVEEIVEEVPQAQALPKTGATNPMIFSGLGSALIGLGLLLRKKKED